MLRSSMRSASAANKPSWSYQKEDLGGSTSRMKSASGRSSSVDSNVCAPSSRQKISRRDRNPIGRDCSYYSNTLILVKGSFANIPDFSPLLPLSPFCSCTEEKLDRQLSAALVARPNSTGLC